MPVLIKGMEMPTSCRECRFCNGHANTDCGVCACCGVDGKIRDAYTRDDCPLVPVPPHGMLGDLDALAEYVHQQDDWLSETAIHAFCGILCKAPTIIPAEEV